MQGQQILFRPRFVGHDVRFHRFGKWPAIHRTSDVIFIACLWCRQIPAIGPRNRKKGWKFEAIYLVNQKHDIWTLHLTNVCMHKRFSSVHATIHNSWKRFYITTFFTYFLFLVLIGFISTFENRISLRKCFLYISRTDSPAMYMICSWVSSSRAVLVFSTLVKRFKFCFWTNRSKLKYKKIRTSWIKGIIHCDLSKDQ